MTNDASQPESDTPEQPAYKKLLAHEQIEFLEKEWESAESRATENWDKLLRSMAELENVKRRSEKEVTEARRYALNRFIEDLLPVVDSLEQALLSCKEGTELETMKEGIELTLKMFVSSLEKSGVKTLNPLNDLFDPNLHEAMMMQETAEYPANTVITVVQKGYRIHDRLIRPARVIVATGA